MILKVEGHKPRQITACTQRRICLRNTPAWKLNCNGLASLVSRRVIDCSCLCAGVGYINENALATMVPDARDRVLFERDGCVGGILWWGGGHSVAPFPLPLMHSAIPAHGTCTRVPSHHGHESHSPAEASPSFSSLALLLSIIKFFNVTTTESSLLVLCTLLLELLLVNWGRWRGLRFGAAADARNDAGLKDRLAMP